MVRQLTFSSTWFWREAVEVLPFESIGRMIMMDRMDNFMNRIVMTLDCRYYCSMNAVALIL